MTLFLTVGVRDTNHRDEFHITTFFRVRFAKGVSLLSTSEFLLWSYSNKTFRTKAFFIGITFGGSIWTRGILFHRLFCYSLYWCSRTALVVVFLYGGSIPFVVSLCFASQRTPTVCAYCAGSISTIGLRSFLLKVSGVSSHLSFCCTSLVSGFIIHARARFVHSQNAQWIRYIFSRNDKKTVLFIQTHDWNSLPAQSGRPAGPFMENLCARTARLLPCYLPPRGAERPVSPYYKQVILLNKNKPLIKKISCITHLTAIWILYTRYTWGV